MNLRRVLILADESANWMVAGLRQLDRLALAIDEFAVDNNETSPVLVAIHWQDDVDRSLRWVPDHPRLTHLSFSSEPQNQDPFDLVLTTRLFVYRKTIGKILEGNGAPSPPFSSWEDRFERTKAALPPCPGALEIIPAHDAIAAIEKRFLRGSGKSQDGFVSRYLNRPLSRTVTRLLLRSPVTPNAWTCLISPIFVAAALIMGRGTYWSFVWGLILYQVFSILDGCDGEIARAKFMESESGRQLDDWFDVFSNVLLALGLGFGLSGAHPPFAWLFLTEGIVAAALIALNEWFLARAPTAESGTLGETLYPRHRALVERSGLLVFGKEFASLVIQFTKRDVAVLFFVLLAAVGAPALILHLLLLATAVTLALALKSR